MSSVCPKCGSNRILNDECLACRIILSKVQRAEKNSSSPVSFVAPSIASPTPNIPGLADNQYKIALKKNKLYIRTFLCVLALAVAGSIYFGFHHFRKSTSEYGGLYRNNRDIFTLRFPDRGWNHYYTNELDSVMLKNPKDAFYAGQDREDPDIFLGMWIEILPHPIQPTIPDDQRQDLFDSATDQLLAKMEAAGLDCTITNSEFIGNGAVMDAEILRNEERLKGKIRTSYFMNRAYTLIIVGRERAMDSADEEIDGIMKSLNFRMTII